MRIIIIGRLYIAHSFLFLTVYCIKSPFFMEGKTGLLYFFFAVRWLLSLDSYSNMASICHLHTPEEYTSLLSLYNMWLFDCDGVLQVWNGDELIDGAVQVLKMLRQQSKSTFVFILSDSDFFLWYLPDKRVQFVSNNSTKSRRELQKKFTKLGVQAHLVHSSSLIIPTTTRKLQTLWLFRMRSTVKPTLQQYTFLLSSNSQKIKSLCDWHERIRRRALRRRNIVLWWYRVLTLPLHPSHPFIHSFIHDPTDCITDLTGMNVERVMIDFTW